MPVDPKGLHPDEYTIAAFLNKNGYATACIGKWHLGDQLPFLPTRHGFDTFFGCPYSEDMEPTPSKPDRPPLPLMRNERVIEAPVDRTLLTRRYTEESIRFITENRDRPFFLYVPHAMPGSTDSPFAGPAFSGKSANGPYGDAVEELDWSCGQIMNTLKELELDSNTLVIWTSDNGAVKRDPPQGSNAPLRGWGYTTTEGGQRVPCIVRWPGKIPAGARSDEVTSMMDLYPTVASLIGSSVPHSASDGQDLLPLLTDNSKFRSLYDDRGFYYYHMHQLQAVRSGPWKLYLPLRNKITNLRGKYEQGTESPMELYNLRKDIGETREVSGQHPEIVTRLSKLAEHARADLGDWDRDGGGQRLAGWVVNPTPRMLEDE